MCQRWAADASSNAGMLIYICCSFPTRFHFVSFQSSRNTYSIQVIKIPLRDPLSTDLNRVRMSPAKHKRYIFIFMVACSTIFLTAYYRRSSLRLLSTSRSSSTMTSPPLQLTQWMRFNKASFLADVEYDGAKKWTIVMGNEAGGKFYSPTIILHADFLQRHQPQTSIPAPRLLLIRISLLRNLRSA